MYVDKDEDIDIDIDTGAHLEAVNVRFDHVAAFRVQVQGLVEICQRLV